MSQPFAKDTVVPVAKSRAEIEQLLSRYGATGFASGWQGTHATILFEARKRRVRFDLPLPDESDAAFARKKTRYGSVATTAAERLALRDAEHHRRWRALCLVIKAKLEAVETGIATFEEEFLANIVVPGGKTLGELALPELARAYDTGAAMPPLLGAGS